MKTEERIFTNSSDSEISGKSGHDHFKIYSPSLEVFITFDSIFIVLCVVGNTFIITVISIRQPLHTPSFLFVLSIAISHLLIGVITLPMFIVGHYPEDYMTSETCKTLEYFNKLSSTASITSLVAFTVDVFISHGRTTGCSSCNAMTYKQAGIILSLIWTFSLAYSILAVFLYDVVLEHHWDGTKYWTILMCEIPVTHHDLHAVSILVDLCCTYLVPLTMLLVLYSCVFYWHWYSLSVNVPAVQTKQRKMQTVAGVILLSEFAVLNFGSYAMDMQLFWGSGYFEYSFILRDVVSLLSYSQSWCNVVLLLAFNKPFREMALHRTTALRRTAIHTNGTGPSCVTNVSHGCELKVFNDRGSFKTRPSSKILDQNNQTSSNDKMSETEPVQCDNGEIITNGGEEIGFSGTHSAQILYPSIQKF